MSNGQDTSFTVFLYIKVYYDFRRIKVSGGGRGRWGAATDYHLTWEELETHVRKPGMRTGIYYVVNLKRPIKSHHKLAHTIMQE